MTPKCAVAAVVGNEAGEILLTQRADSGIWLYPVGWADVGYSPSEVAVKEVYEETGIEVEPVSLIAVLDGLRLGFARLPLYSLVFHCRMLGGELVGHPLETRQVGLLPPGPPAPAPRRPAPLGRPGVPGHRRRAVPGRLRPAPRPRRGGASRDLAGTAFRAGGASPPAVAGEAPLPCGAVFGLIRTWQWSKSRSSSPTTTCSSGRASARCSTSRPISRSSASPRTTTGWSRGADEARPQVVVTDIRMPPSFQNEGIEAAKEVRKRHPGTGVVILSQYDDPEYAISLLSEGAAGYAYLLKDRVSDGNRLARAIREVATGGSMLDPEIVQALVAPVRVEGELTEEQEELLRQVAEGRPVKAIATSRGTTPEAVNDDIEQVFLDLARGASAGQEGALRRLRLLQKAIVEREEQGETLSRLLPGGVAERLRDDPDAIGRTERLDVTVLMSDVRGLLGHRGAQRPDRARRASSTGTGPR